MYFKISSSAITLAESTCWSSTPNGETSCLVLGTAAAATAATEGLLGETRGFMSGLVGEVAPLGFGEMAGLGEGLGLEGLEDTESSWSRSSATLNGHDMDIKSVRCLNKSEYASYLITFKTSVID